MSAKGYVVRWTEYEYPYTGAGVPQCQEAATLPEIMKVYDDLGAMGQRILAVAEDGTETPLPSYEEALATLDLLREFAELEAEGCESLEKGADATASYCCGKRATLLGLVQSINDPASLREYMARPGTLLDEVRRKRAANAGEQR